MPFPFLNSVFGLGSVRNLTVSAETASWRYMLLIPRNGLAPRAKFVTFE